jgi:hypothetical protein
MIKVDFTREPIIETVITPKEGCKLVVRSSKSAGQEEYFVDAVEMVSFGHSFFFRSLERPKTFFVPATDYEILEVRETRMVLKNVGLKGGGERTIKIAGGREAQMRATREREHAVEKEKEAEAIPAAAEAGETAQTAEEKDGRTDKKRERRRNYRKRRGRETGASEEEKAETGAEAQEVLESQPSAGEEASPLTQQVATTSILTSLLPPPPMLISDTIEQFYKKNAKFKDLFYSKTETKTESAPIDALASEKELAPEELPAPPSEEQVNSAVMTFEEQENSEAEKQKRSRKEKEEA